MSSYVEALVLRNHQQPPKPDVLAEPLPVELFNSNDVHSVSNVECAFQTKGVR